ncbi:hypothetical protein N7497_011344 [Penicillium chrysogenum]|nr:hypothetical protein N7497_011344 [Penicillium chrysogenum]
MPVASLSGPWLLLTLSSLALFQVLLPKDLDSLAELVQTAYPVIRVAVAKIILVALHQITVVVAVRATVTQRQSAVRMPPRRTLTVLSMSVAVPLDSVVSPPTFVVKAASPTRKVVAVANQNWGLVVTKGNQSSHLLREY